MRVGITRINKHGKGLCLYLTAEILEHCTWKHGDRVSVRPAGEKFILERIPLEKFSTIRTGEAGASAQ